LSMDIIHHLNWVSNPSIATSKLPDLMPYSHWQNIHAKFGMGKEGTLSGKNITDSQCFYWVQQIFKHKLSLIVLCFLIPKMLMLLFLLILASFTGALGAKDLPILSLSLKYHQFYFWRQNFIQ
jgi:hypothetical protein